MSTWEKTKDDAVKCLLCPHNCIIRSGSRGVCGVRENRGGELNLNTYGIISGLALDPVEKKPLYHFHPGSVILSAGSYGCNLKCDFCQNYHISQNVSAEGSAMTEPARLVRQAGNTKDNLGIAYTYNEPVIWFEYIMDCAGLAATAGLKNVMVTNGYINAGPLNELIGVIDAFNIDLKAFSNDFYRRFTGSTLQPVLDAIKKVATSGRHLEITTLILPGLNDSRDDMKREAEWIAENAGQGVPLHISRYYPMYRRNTPATPPETITGLREIASDYLDFVYTGNLSGDDNGKDTLCPSCKTLVIKRSGYNTEVCGLTAEGSCLKCGRQIINEEMM